MPAAYYRRDLLVADAQTGRVAGAFAFDEELGSTYHGDDAGGPVVQTGAIALSVGPKALPCAVDTVKIVANGAGISVPGGWVNTGTTAIDPTNGKINIIIVAYFSPSDVRYSVTVI